MTKSASLAPPPLSLRERNKLRVRADVLDAASLMLSEVGYREMTLEGVSARAGVSRATLYVHFAGGRDEIVRDAYVRVADALRERGLELHAAATTPVDAIIGLAQAMIEIANDPGAKFYLAGEQEISGVITSVAGRTAADFVQVITEDLAGSEVVEVGKEEPLAIALVGAIRGCGLAAAAQPDRSSVLLDGLRLLISRLLQQSASFSADVG